MREEEWEDKRHEKHFGSRHNVQSRGHPIRPMEPPGFTSRSPSRSSSRPSASRSSTRGSTRGSTRESTRGSSAKKKLLPGRELPSLLNAEENIEGDAAGSTTSSRRSSRAGSMGSSRAAPPPPSKWPKNSSVPRKISTLNGQEVRQVAAGGKHTLFITKNGNLYSCGTAGSNARLGHLNDEEQSVPKLVEYFTKRTIAEDDRWVVQFKSVFSLSPPIEFVHDRR